MSRLNLVLAGTPEFALPCFDALLKSEHTIRAVFTQPDRPAGRGMLLKQSAVKEWGLSHDLRVHQPEHLKSEALNLLEQLKPDLMIVIAYGLILPKSVLMIPKLGCINVHASLLPRWRGASPINHAILHGDSQSGVSIMFMEAGMDTGPLICTQVCEVTLHDTAGSLHDSLAQLSVSPLLKTIDHLAKFGDISSNRQDSSLATYANKIIKSQATIDWNQPAVQIDRQIRAFNPWPIAYTHAGHDLIRIHQAQVIFEVAPMHLSSLGKKPGTILDISPKGILVATGHHQLLIERIQFPGKKVLTVSQWLHGAQSSLQVGFVFQ